MSCATLAAALFAPTPAAAGPGYVNVQVGHGFRHYPRAGYYAPRYRAGYRYGRHYGPRRFRGHYRRGGIGPAEAFGITAGIIGGAILLDRAFDDRYRTVDREVVYLPRYPADYDAWGDAPRDLRPDYRRPGDTFEPGVRFDRDDDDRDDGWDDDGLEDDRDDDDRREENLDDARRRLEAERRAFEDERARFEEERRRYLEDRDFRDRDDDPAFDDDDFEPEDLRPSPIRPIPDREAGGRALDDDPLDEELLGAPDVPAQRIAFGECAAEVRSLAGAQGLIVSLPATPTEAPADLGGGVVRLSAAFTAAGEDGYDYRRLMICDVDARGVKRLEVV
ncbi:MAG: hypothetical protein GC152_02835 [Alphaproteobacteria bacterium]|nr:hypothetical protein [Alphaproteobacteria bacterium]